MFNVNYSNINGAVAVAAHRGVKSGEADRKIKHGGDDDEAVNTTTPAHRVQCWAGWLMAAIRLRRFWC